MTTFIHPGYLNPPSGMPLLGAGVLSRAVESVPWSVDATSAKGVPANATEWSALLASAGIGSGNPSNLFLLQEASGTLADSIGSLSLAQVNAGTTYSNAISGWSRVAVGTAESTGAYWRGGNTSTPDPSAESVALLCYLRIDSATAERNLFGADQTTNDFLAVNVNAAGTLRVYVDATATNGTSVYEGGAVFPAVVIYNRTAGTAKLYTDAEKATLTYTAVGANGFKQIGGTTTATARFLYYAMFRGSAAELSDAQVKSLLQTLSWTIPWT